MAMSVSLSRMGGPRRLRARTALWCSPRTASPKQFGSLRAVDGLDIDVCRGDVFGFLGPNGAGKTTVIRLVPGPDLPDRRLRRDPRPSRAGAAAPGGAPRGRLR